MPGGSLLGSQPHRIVPPVGGVRCGFSCQNERSETVSSIRTAAEVTSVLVKDDSFL